MIARIASLINVGTLTSEASVRALIDFGEISPAEMAELYEMRKGVVVGVVLSNETDLNDFIEWQKDRPPRKYEPLIKLNESSEES